MYREFADLVCENYHLLSEETQRRYDSQGNYLFCSQIQQASNSSTEDLLHPEGIHYEGLNGQNNSKEGKTMFGILSKGGQDLLDIIEHVVEKKLQERASKS